MNYFNWFSCRREPLLPKDRLLIKIFSIRMIINLKFRKNLDRPAAILSQCVLKALYFCANLSWWSHFSCVSFLLADIYEGKKFFPFVCKRNGKQIPTRHTLWSRDILSLISMFRLEERWAFRVIKYNGKRHLMFGR